MSGINGPGTRGESTIEVRGEGVRHTPQIVFLYMLVGCAPELFIIPLLEKNPVFPLL